MQLVEHFISINGEGQHAGELALFLRFAGCNLQCDWCDTAWANAPDVPFVQADLQMLWRSPAQPPGRVCAMSR